MRTKKRFLALLLIFIIPCINAAAPAPDKVTAEEVIAKHLAAIGSAEALAAVKTRIAVGNAKAITHSKAMRDVTGVAQFASDGDKILLAMIFNLLDYPYDKAGYDGQKMTVALLPTSGSRTSLGDFFVSHNAVFKEGLIGGVLSSAWPLLDSASKKPKLSFAGTDKIDGREVYKLKYPPPKGSGDFQINLFFDAETFRHVRTEYQYVISNQMGARPSEFGTTNTGSQTRSRTKLVEDFSDFKTENNLTLPHTYTIRFTQDAYQRTVVLEWVINFSQFIFNQEIDTGAFNVSASK